MLTQEGATVQVAVPSPSSLFTAHGGHQLKKTWQMVPSKYCLPGVSTFPDFSVLAALGWCLALGQSLFAPRTSHQEGLALVLVFFDRFLLPWIVFSLAALSNLTWSQIYTLGLKPTMADEETSLPLHLLCFLLEWENRTLSRDNYCIQKPEALTDFSRSYHFSALIPKGAKMGLYQSTARINLCLWNAFNT